MRSWKRLRLTSHTWLGLNPQIGRPTTILNPFKFYIIKIQLSNKNLGDNTETPRKLVQKYEINEPE
jgi:hypothetical protein